MSAAEEAVVNFFLDKYIYLRQEWLKVVLNFLRQKGVDFSRTDQVCNLVYEQWLYSDIVETTEASTSDIDTAARLTTLQEPLILQLKSALDVSTSIYSQVKSFTSMFVDNSGFEALTENEKEAFQQAKPQRTLTLLLTNGVQDYNAIEFKPIRELTLTTKPGTKVLFLPPMKCRRGRFFLEATNFQILGGEVESYIDRFQPVKVMSALIGVAPKPITVSQVAEPPEPPQRSIPILPPTSGPRSPKRILANIQAIGNRTRLAEAVQAQREQSMFVPPSSQIPERVLGPSRDRTTPAKVIPNETRPMAELNQPVKEEKPPRPSDNKEEVRVKIEPEEPDIIFTPVPPPPKKMKQASEPRRSFKLLHDHILVLPEKSQGNSRQAKVVATGPGARNEKGELVPLSVQVGDCVLLSENSGTKIVFEGKEHAIIREQDLLAVFN